MKKERPDGDLPSIPDDKKLYLNQLKWVNLIVELIAAVRSTDTSSIGDARIIMGYVNIPVTDQQNIEVAVIYIMRIYVMEVN